MTRLYIVEGLPCSGKSTTARHVADWLLFKNRKVTFIDEGTGEHPADYESHAYITGGQLAAFPPGLRERLRTSAEPRLDGYVIPMQQFGGVALDKLKPYKIYDVLPWEEEKPLMLDKWASFVEDAEESTVYVFNCVLLQNPMCETMMRFNFPEESSLEHISKIAELIAPLEPAVIYLKNDEISQSIRSAADEREGWLESVIDYHVNGGYGKSIGAKGFEGYISCLEERQRRELSILEKLPVKSLIVENPQRDWDAAHREIIDFIKQA